MFNYVPKGLPAGAPLVVVLHGCRQTAADYVHGAGWSTLADRLRFAVPAPEQKRSNNGNGCFNWFLPGDSTRDQGEAASIRHMIEQCVSDHGIQRGRVRDRPVGGWHDGRCNARCLSRDIRRWSCCRRSALWFCGKRAGRLAKYANAARALY